MDGLNSSSEIAVLIRERIGGSPDGKTSPTFYYTQFCEMGQEQIAYWQKHYEILAKHFTGITH